MATPPNPHVYMHDDWAWTAGPGTGSTAWQNFYLWDGHGSLGQYGYGSGPSRGYGFAGEPSSGAFGWTIIDLDTLFAITDPTAGQRIGFNPLENTANADIMDFKEASGGPTHVRIKTDASSRIIALNGNGTLIGTSDYILPHSAADGSGPTNHTEALCTVHGSAGVLKVRINDIDVLELTGKNTRNGGTGVIGCCHVYGTASRRLAEWAVHSGTGWLGSKYRSASVPIGSAGTYTNGTVFGAGSQLLALTDEAVENAAYAILDASGTPKKSSFVSGALPVTALTVRDVHPQIIRQKSDGGANTDRIGLKSGATEIFSTNAAGVPDAWGLRRLALRRDITAGNPLWTPATTEASEIIINRIT